MERARKSTPWWLWANLCSLDAPIVAMSWLWLFSQIWQVQYLPGAAYLALACAVWSVYIFDRLLDFVFRGEQSGLLRERHSFHFQHRWSFLVLGLVNALVALITIFWFLPREVFAYAPIMLAGITIYFCFVVIWKRGASRIKNLLAGLMFAYGTAAFAHSYVYYWSWEHLIFSRDVFYFSILCIVNIKAIDSWEHLSAWRGGVVDEDLDDEMLDQPVDRREVLIREAQASNQLWVRVLLVVLAGMALSSALSPVQPSLRAYFLSMVVGAGALLSLDRYSSRFSPELLRVLADGAIVLPVILYALLR